MTDADGRAPWPQELVTSYFEQGLWSSDESIATFTRRWARERPDHLAVVDNVGGQLTYAELHERTSRLAAALEQQGIERGDVVGVQLPNHVTASVVAVALAKLGAVVNPLVPMYRDRELTYMAEQCQTKALVVPGTYRNVDYVAMAARVADGVSSIRAIVATDGDQDGAVGLETLLERGGSQPTERYDDPTIDPGSVAAVLFTSGTESNPKGALHSHNTLLVNDRSVTQLLGLTSEDGVFMPSPVGHGTGFGFGILLALYLGSTLALQDGWDPAEAVGMIDRYGCGYMHAATPFAQDMLELPDLGGAELARFRHFVSGGASIPPDLVGRIRDRLGCTLLRLYGQTEAFMTTVNRPDDPDDALATTDGAPAPGVDFQTWDDDGRQTPLDTPGEAVCRGPHRCLGFLADPERQALAIDREGWLRMGDLCTIREDGHVTVVGRKKEVINRGGYKFSPREVEDVLHSHPDILRVAVVRMADARLGEKACAFVIPRGHAELSVEAVGQFLRQRGVAPYKWPERVELVEELPTTASGKVQKFVLEQRLAEAVG